MLAHLNRISEGELALTGPDENVDGGENGTAGEDFPTWFAGHRLRYPPSGSTAGRSLETILRDPLAQRLAVYPEDLGRLRLVAAGARQDIANVIGFHLRQRPVHAGGAQDREPGESRQVRTSIVCSSFMTTIRWITFSSSRIARPGVILHRLHGLFREAWYRLAQLGGELLREMTHQQRNVATRSPQRRDFDRRH